MITFLEGQVVSVTEKQLVLDVNHVGFRVGICARDSVNMPPEGETVRIYTYMSVREDAISLFGFLSEDDVEIYKLLITVSGIGPKGALGILSIMSGDDVRLAVLADDAKSISKAPGVGNKTAQKLILELKDKIDPGTMLDKMRSGADRVSGNPTFEANKEEAVQVLCALGFSRSEALGMVRRADLQEDMDADGILSAALHERGGSS